LKYETIVKAVKLCPSVVFYVRWAKKMAVYEVKGRLLQCKYTYKRTVWWTL